MKNAILRLSKIVFQKIFIFATKLLPGLRPTNLQRKQKRQKKVTKIQNNQFTYTVYSKKNCSFCDRAIILLQDRDHHVVVKKIDEDISYFAEMREKAPDMRTMPVIFKDDQLIGGYSDLIDSLHDE